MADKNAAQAATMAALCKMREDDCLTDLIVKCGAKEHKVHKTLLCASSDWFKKACAGPFREVRGKMIELHEDEEQAASAMIHFCYHFDYEIPATVPTPMTFHVRMFSIGEKYLMPALQSLAVLKFKSSAQVSWDVEDFATAVKEAYEETIDPDRALKAAVVAISTDHSAELFEEKGGNAVFEKMANRLPAYAMDVLREAKNPKTRTRDCHSQ